MSKIRTEPQFLYPIPIIPFILSFRETDMFKNIIYIPNETIFFSRWET